MADHAVPRPAKVAFVLIYLSYVVLYFNRRNYGFWLSGLIERKELSATEAAVFGSTMELAYGIGKLFAGPVADNVPSGALLTLSIVVASVCNALMFTSGIFLVDVMLWGINGFVQAFSWPALALIFFNWFGKFSGRGTLYSILSTNQNLGSALTPILLTPLVASFGWRAALWGPAFVGGGMTLLLLLLLHDGPKSTAAKQPKSGPTEAPVANFAAVVREMLFSPDVWLLGLGYALLTFARVGVSDWSLVFLKERHRLTPEVARDCLVSLEVGGFLGGLAAGFVSDALFRGQRGPVMVAFAAAIASPAVWCIFNAASVNRFTLSAFYFAFGFGSFGPHVLVGLMARELFPTAPSTAGSFAKSLAQVGGSLAGVPVSYLAQHQGWWSVGMAWTLALFLSGVAFAPLAMRRVKVD